MSATNDQELDAVQQSILNLDRNRERIASVLRNTFDQLYDGQRTGRYRWDQLFKTEKTHCGTLVEINLCREFRFKDGTTMDFSIENVEVDCKFSQDFGGWMIPKEAMGHLCMLVWADDASALWSLGLVRIVEEILTRGKNQDSKRSITKAGREAIRLLFKEEPLPPNVLLQLPPETINRIFSQPSGQKKVNELFRVAQKRIIGRAVIATVAQQDDFMKRVRGNGGARSRLKREGIIILGQYETHRQIAQKLGVPIPGWGEMISVRVCRAAVTNPSVVEIGGNLWRLASPEDPVVEAPDVPYKN